MGDVLMRGEFLSVVEGDGVHEVADRLEATHGSLLCRAGGRSGWLSEQGIKLSYERIYQMIWDDKRDGGNLWRSLRRRGKRYNKRAGKNAGRGLISDQIDISERSAIVARKTRLGDWEGDTVVSAGHKGGLLTLVERKTRLTKITKLPRATAARQKRLPCVASSL